MDWTPLAISVGAVLGALGRYYFSLFWLQRAGDRFPYGTLFVNLTGAFIIGIVATAAPTWGLPPAWQTLIQTGFLGAYTTFSTYILDTAKLFSSQQRLKGLLYWLGSAVLGFVGVELGIWIGSFWL